MTIFMIDYEYLFDAIYIFKSVRLYSNRIQLFTWCKTPNFINLGSGRWWNLYFGKLIKIKKQNLCKHLVDIHFKYLNRTVSSHVILGSIFQNWRESIVSIQSTYKHTPGWMNSSTKNWKLYVYSFPLGHQNWSIQNNSMQFIQYFTFMIPLCTIESSGIWKWGLELYNLKWSTLI